MASLVLLERRLRAAGLPVEALYDPARRWEGFDAFLDDWIAGAARGIAHAVAAASAIIDFEAAVIDGAFPERVCQRIVVGVAEELRRLDLSGIVAPALRAGSIGPIARALGGASLPLFDRYLLDQHTLAGPVALQRPRRPPVTPSRTRGRRPEGAPSLAAKPAPQRRVRKAMFSSRCLPPATAAM